MRLLGPWVGDRAGGTHPGRDDGSPDAIANGLAACPNHHAAFDRGLPLGENDGRIVFNEDLAVQLGLDPEGPQAFS